MVGCARIDKTQVQEVECVYVYSPCPSPEPIDLPKLKDEYLLSPSNAPAVAELIRVIWEDRNAWKRTATCYKAQEGK